MFARGIQPQTRPRSLRRSIQRMQQPEPGPAPSDAGTSQDVRAATRPVALTPSPRYLRGADLQLHNHNSNTGLIPRFS